MRMIECASRVEIAAWLVGSMITMGCAAPCQDDGLLQELCHEPAADGTDGSGEPSREDTTGGEPPAPGEGEGSGEPSGSSGSGPGSADTTAGPAADTTATADGTQTEGEGGGPWCIDDDGDGFGDPAQCSDRPSPGTVNNDGDCNDADAATHPGAAELEPDPTACATDADGDGWGDATPADGAVAGADCWDEQPALSPSVVLVGTVDHGPLDDVAATVDHGNAMLSVVAPLDTPPLGWSATAATLRSSGELVAIDQVSGHLQRIDYQGVCDGTSAVGQAEEFGPDFGDASLCGLSFDADDRLWAVDAQNDQVLELDPASGAVLSGTQLTAEGEPLELVDCDLTWDCHDERLLVADAAAGQVLELDPASGQVGMVAEYDPDLGPVGMAYDPIDRVVWVSSGIELNHVPLDGAAASEVGMFTYDGATIADVANLALLPTCG
jgi:hypothetical protein